MVSMWRVFEFDESVVETLSTSSSTSGSRLPRVSLGKPIPPKDRSKDPWNNHTSALACVDILFLIRPPRGCPKEEYRQILPKFG